MGNSTIYPFGVGGETPSGIGLNAGTFAEAYDIARLHNYIFSWMLQDIDEVGNAITKMIWHIGNRHFVDAIGAEIDGTKNGLTVTCSEPCYLKTSRSSTRFPMSIGKNNFSFEELGFDSNNPVESTAVSMNVYAESTGNTTAWDSVTGVDFGGMILSVSNASYEDSFRKAEFIKRLKIKMAPYNNEVYNVFKNLQRCKFLQVSTFGTLDLGHFYGCFGCATSNYLLKADMSGFDVQTTGTHGTTFLTATSVLEELDIRGLDTSTTKKLQITGSQNLEKLVIGNLDNSNFSTTIGLGCSDAVLICTTNTPPNLKNCAFSDGVAQDEYSSTYDWVAGHFSAIYVPTDAVTAYKENVYVENGAVGNTGWSVYTDIIHDIAEYNG